MSFLSTIRATPITGQIVNYTFTQNVDTTTLQPGQAFDIRSYLLNQGIIRNSKVSVALTLTIAPGVTIGSSDVTKPALTIANFHPRRDRIKLINNGSIQGAGGYAGTGGSNGGSGQSGGNGGTALLCTNLIGGQVTIINNGTIYGGGGGGGGAGSIYYEYGACGPSYGLNYGACGFQGGNCNNCCYTCCNNCPGTCGAGCDPHCDYDNGCWNCNQGSCDCGYSVNCYANITITGYNAGSSGGVGAGYNQAASYNGGSFGASGGNGAGNSTSGGLGGRAGYYLSGSTYIKAGSILGTVAGSVL